jgi:hypothetical protein
MKGWLLIIFFSLLVHITTPALGFDYSAYKPSSLREIGDITRKAEETYKYEGGFDFYTERLRVRVCLSEYPQKISIGPEKLLELYFKTRGLNQDHLKLYTDQLNLEKGGYSFVLVFQNQLIPFLRKEVKQGDDVDLYVLFGIYDVKYKKIILLVNEFSTCTEEDETKQG